MLTTMCKRWLFYLHVPYVLSSRRSVKRSVTDRKSVKDQLDDIEDHRPFFTYWVTTVQVLILIISLACYGLGPVGLDLSHRSGQVNCLECCSTVLFLRCACRMHCHLNPPTMIA